MAYTRRQELMCTESQMRAKPNVVLRENEAIYIKMNDGTLRQKIGDGVTTIINLPFTQVFDGSVVQTTGYSESDAMSQKAVTDELDNIKDGKTSALVLGDIANGKITKSVNGFEYGIRHNQGGSVYFAWYAGVTLKPISFKAGDTIKGIADGYRYLLVDSNGNYDQSVGYLTTDYTISADCERYLQISRPDQSHISSINDLDGLLVIERDIFSDGGSVTEANDVAYVATTGNDDNSGTSRSTPFATIQKAIDGGFKTILVREGVYDDGIVMQNITGVTIALDHAYDSFSAGTDEDSPKVVIDGTNKSVKYGVMMSGCARCTFENIEIRNCNRVGFSVEKSEALRFDDCIVHDMGLNTESAPIGGFIMKSTNADFYNCVAYNIGTDAAGQQRGHFDGFGFSVTGTANLYNCSAWNCEDDGVSHHDACCGVVDGGEWYNCGKGGVATPTHGAKVNVKNVYSHDNLCGLYADNDNAVTDRGNILVFNSVFKNNREYDIHNGSYYQIVAVNCVYDTVRMPSKITAFN